MSSKSELVTLKHGGQLLGKAITFNGQQVNLFLGEYYEYYYQHDYLIIMYIYGFVRVTCVIS